MPEERAIPDGFMTIGQIAKKMGVTVRTLQYYDKEGLLTPTAESTGGRRLYTDKDVIKLHQLLAMKNLGFSLKDIKTRLPTLDTPEDVAAALAKLAQDTRNKIENLTKNLADIELLQAEVLQMQSVDFKKYSDIIVNLEMNNEYYWLIKHFDESTMDLLRSRFDRESGLAFMADFKSLNQKILLLQQSQVSPESEEAQKTAREFWNLIMEFTKGDMSLIPKLMEMGSLKQENPEWEQMPAITSHYIGKALEYYFDQQGLNPFN